MFLGTASGILSGTYPSGGGDVLEHPFGTPATSISIADEVPDLSAEEKALLLTRPFPGDTQDSDQPWNNTVGAEWPGQRFDFFAAVLAHKFLSSANESIVEPTLGNKGTNSVVRSACGLHQLQQYSTPPQFHSSPPFRFIFLFFDATS
jgi:hypothetical protein